MFSMQSTPTSRPRYVPLAFAMVYIVWGTTYLGARIAGETLPVPIVSAARVGLSTIFLLVICLVRRTGLRVPPGEAPKLVLIGILMMVLNNLMLTAGVQMVRTGIASLVLALTLLLIAVLDRIIPGRTDRLLPRGWLGMGVGTGGILLLLWPRLAAHRMTFGNEQEHFWIGSGLCLGAALSFSLASVLSRRWNFQADTWVATTWQVGTAAIINTSLALALCGNPLHAAWNSHNIGALLYLSTFGSLLTFASFTYLLRNAPVTRVGTYAFVNPIIAVLLGVAVLHERFVPVELAGMLLIVAAVALVVLSREPIQPTVLDPHAEDPA